MTSDKHADLSFETGSRAYLGYTQEAYGSKSQEAAIKN